MPALTPHLNQSPPAAPSALQTTAPNYDSNAAAEHPSNTSMTYSHRDWEQAQGLDPVRDTTRRYTKLGFPKPKLPPTLCDHMPSHARPETTDIADLAAKGHLLQGDDDTILLVRKLIPVTSAPDDHYDRRSPPPFDDLVRIYMPLLARSWIMHACHANASCHLGVTRTLKMLEHLYWWVDMEACYKWWVRRCLK